MSTITLVNRDGQGTEYEILGQTKFWPESSMNDMDREFASIGLERANHVGSYFVYLVRPTSEPTLSQIYAKQFGAPGARIINISENDARVATEAYLGSMQLLVQRGAKSTTPPYEDSWIYFLVDTPDHNPPKCRCDNATYNNDDCIYGNASPDVMDFTKRSILVPDGYTVSTAKYVQAEGIALNRSGDNTLGQAVAVMTKEGKGGGGWSGNWMQTDEFLGTRCNVNVNRDIRTMFDNCYPATARVYGEFDAAIAENVIVRELSAAQMIEQMGLLAPGFNALDELEGTR